MNPAVTLAFALTISITFHKGDKVLCYVQLSLTYPRSSKKSSLSFYPPPLGIGWLRGTVVERWSLTGELSLSCSRPAAEGHHLCG